MLQALFCEAVPHGPAAVTVVGGFVFDPRGLERFGSKWTPKITGLSKPFSSDSCRQGLVPFESLAWTRERRFGLLNELAELTADTMLAGFAVATSVDDYREYLDTYPGAEKLIDCPHTFCVMGVLALARHWTERYSRPESIHYWFETGAPHETQDWEFVRKIGLTPKMAEQFRMGAYSWAPRLSAPALCGADLLVWEWQRRHAENAPKGTDRIGILRRNEDKPLYTEYLTALRISHSAMFNLVRERYYV